MLDFFENMEGGVINLKMYQISYGSTRVEQFCLRQREKVLLQLCICFTVVGYGSRKWIYEEE
jgi:hypothetical protein